MIPDKILDFVRPPDDNAPAPVKRWRWNVVLTLIAFWVFGIWAVTPAGFVRADSMDKKVTAVVEPLRQQVADIEAKVDANTKETKEVKSLLIRKLIEDKVREIRNAKMQQCKATDIRSADYHRDQVEASLLDYTDLTGREYRVPTCAEL